jgi:hypothetical protein
MKVKPATKFYTRVGHNKKQYFISVNVWVFCHETGRW